MTRLPTSVCCKVRGITDGLHYLHTRNVAHGDLKGVRNCPKSRFTAVSTPIQPNILVSATGEARITDFGLATITRDQSSPTSTTNNDRHIPQWPAPEILWTGSPTTRESDVFSFGMVTFQVGPIYPLNFNHLIRW